MSLGLKLLTEVSERIQWAVNYRAQFEPEWLQAFEMYAGDQVKTHERSVASPLVVNMFWPLCQQALATLWYRAPYVFARPGHQTKIEANTQIDLEANARCAEAVANRPWRSRRMKRGVEENIIDSLIYSVGWQKSGYGSDFGLRKEEVALDQEIFAELRQLIPDITEEDARNMIPGGKREGELTEFDDTIARGYAWSRRIHPTDIWIDPDATDEFDARFIIHRYWRQIRSIRADAEARGYYNIRDLTPHRRTDGTLYGAEGEGDAMYPRGVQENKDLPPQIGTPHDRDPVEGVWLYDFWDKEHQDVYTLVQQGKNKDQGPGGWRDIKRYGTWPFVDVGGFPFKALRLNIVPGRFYPYTGIQQWAPQQKELNLYRSIMADTARRMGKKVVAKDGFFKDGPEETKIEKAEVGTLIKCGSDMDPRKDIAPLDFGAIPPDLYRMSGVIQQDIGNITGYSASPNAQGQPNPRETTATEVNRMSQAITTMSDFQLTLVSEFAADVTRDHFLIVRQFWTGDQMIQAVNQTDAQKWMKVGPTELRGEFDFQIEIGSTQRQSNELRQKRANELLQLMMNPAAQAAYGQQYHAILTRILAWALRAYGFEYPDEIFKTENMAAPPPPMPEPGVPGQPGPAGGAMQPNQAGGGIVGDISGMENMQQMLQGVGP